MHVQKLLPSKKPVVLVDTREIHSRVVEELSLLECEIREKPLPIGDYICSDRICVERKTAEDFIASIIDKRLFKQMEHLTRYEKPVLIVEGHNFYSRNVHVNAIFGALSSVIADYGISVLHTSNPRETAMIIFNLARREQLAGKRDVLLRHKPKAGSIGEMQLHLVAGLPSVSVTLAKRLLEHFKTPKNVFAASEARLQQVEGIGERKARMIWKILNEEWREE